MNAKKLFVLSLLSLASIATAKVNFTAGVMRNEGMRSGLPVTLEVGQREMCYHDESVYIESELLEETADRCTFQFTVATKNEHGAYMVRGLPKLSFAMNQERIMNGTLRCDGPNETFTLIAKVEKIVPAAE